MTQSSQRLTAALSDRYRLERELGAGGMATVYLAEDVKHRRKVAIKVLHPELSAVIGGDRFLKEIELTASLQHPHILPLFDSGAADNLLYYVMPYVEGETLRGRLERERQLPLEDAVSIAQEVASALDYAHKRGVVHRDIKPENVLLQDGKALVADFGIALAVSNAGQGRLTQTGLSLGTPHYMSPEQAMGEREITARSDIYALGAMTYEMLVGEPPFTGPSAQAIVAKVLTERPVPVTVHRDTVPAHVAATLHKALAKLPADRFGSAAEFARALVNPSFTSGDTRSTVALPAAGTARPSPRLAWPAVALGGVLLAGLAGAAGWALRPEPPKAVRRYDVFPQGDMGLLTLSPDGSTLAATGIGTDSVGSPPSLWLRPLDQLDATRIPGVRPTSVAFSPDGRELVVGTMGGLMRVSRSGAVSGPIADSVEVAGWWGRDGYVYFTRKGWYLARVQETGGPVEPLTTNTNPVLALDIHVLPQLLPSGKALLFTAIRSLSSMDAHEVRVLDLETRAVTTLVRGFSARYGGGRLVFISPTGALVQAPFDPDRLELTGTPELVAMGIATYYGVGNVALADNGTLLYQLGGSTTDAQGFQPRVVSRDGRSARPLPHRGTRFNSVRLSPDGTRVAYEVTDGVSGGGDIYVVALGDSVPVRVTREGLNMYPVWTPDARRVVFSRLLDGKRDLAWQAADGSGRAEVLLSLPGDAQEVVFAPDGKLVVREGDASKLSDLDLVVADPASSTATPFAADSSVDERAPRLSPDGRWLAFVANRKGREEVFVRPYPVDGSGAEWQVSDAGGTEPVWARSGRELFFKSSESLYSAEIRTAPGFAVGARRRLFSVTGYLGSTFHAHYDVLPGDTAFIMLGTASVNTDRRTIIVENWLDELERKGAR
jgi:serine/threonine-protein kinase